MKLVIHAGTHKTASTTFQNLCMSSRATLEKDGVLFPMYSNWEQHSFAAWMLQKRDFANLKLFLNSAFSQTEKKDCKITLISGEDFENCLVDTHLAYEFETIARSSGYTELEWVVVKRDQFDYLQSIYAEKSMYQMCLDLELMANLIIDYGFISPGGRRYNYKFVFDILKFSEIFKQNVNSNFQIIYYEDFIADFAGKPLLKKFLGEKSLNTLRTSSKSIGSLKKRDNIRTVEFRYVANFLGVNPSKEFYESNVGLVDDLVAHRIKRNETILKDIETKFKHRFQ